MKPQMIKYYFHRSCYCLLLVLSIFNSSNGQTKQDKVSANNFTKLPRALNDFAAAAVDCAIQDKDGNIWLGTNGEGLFRYDGNAFSKFTEKSGLGNRYIYSLLQDRQGNIWVGTRTGLYCFNGKSFAPVIIKLSGGNNFNYSNLSDNNQSLHNGVWSMMQDKSGTVWFGTDDGVYCYDGMNFSRFLDNSIINKDGLALKGIFSFAEDQKGNIWFGSCIGEGLIRFDGKAVERITPKGYSRTQNLLLDRQGNIWFASIGKGMCQYNGKAITTNFFNEKSTYDLMYSILKDKDDHLWFSEPSNNRTLCYYDGNELHNFTAIKNLPDPKMYPILEDNLGNIWLSAEGMRLFKWNGKAFINLSE